MARRPRVVWTLPAANDLDDIVAWIALDDRTVAEAFLERVLVAVERLVAFPQSGRRLPELPKARYRELIVPPCRIVYRVDGARILIVHLFRGQRRLRRRRLR
jgi:toxin ParE1/3/4